MATCYDVAEYFLAVQDTENDITNLKLQKLCAYAQAISLALLGRKLFSERVEAWTHGPVIPEVYFKFEASGRMPIPPTGLSEEFARIPFDDEQKFILELVANYYGEFSAWILRERSHRDFPGQFGSKRVIPENDMAAAFANDPLVKKIKSYYKNPKLAEEQDFASTKEVFDALAV